MSVRGGPRGGHGRGSGRGRGRGRGRGKTMIWEWEDYTPGPEVYDSLWHIRNAPATVTPVLPTECPIPHAQSRIKDRRQTEGDIQRNFYVVEVTRFDERNASGSSAGDDPDSTEIYHVDLSRILEFVSPDELERYENEQFKIEAEAEAVAMRIEAEETARRRLEKNARVTGAGKGSRLLSGLRLDAEVRMRGRPRGRGRGRGRGSWRGRGALVVGGQLRDKHMEEELVDIEPDLALHRENEDTQLVIAETDSDENSSEDDGVEEMGTSPGLARSAFVANSALPVSPVAPLRRPLGVPIVQRAQSEDSDADSDIDLVDADTGSMSSAAMQLHLEDDRGRVGNISEDDEEIEEESDHDRHRSKRRRTESTASNQRASTSHQQRSRAQPSLARSIPESSPESESESSSEEVIAMQAPPPRRNGTTVPSQPPDDIEESSEEEKEDAEEYVVEAIIEHYREAGKKFYLVKWQGYEDSHDWLPEEDLAGAKDLVAEYNAEIRGKKKLMRRR